jgi:hypothetical protein
MRARTKDSQWLLSFLNKTASIAPIVVHAFLRGDFARAKALLFRMQGVNGRSAVAIGGWEEKIRAT